LLLNMYVNYVFLNSFLALPQFPCRIIRRPHTGGGIGAR
jgi:hypothetical protein